MSEQHIESFEDAQLYCTFHVRELVVGIPVSRVQEVLARQKVTTVPQGPGGMLGLVNLRGQVVTALDMRRRLGRAEAADPMPTSAVVVNEGEGMVSLLVDEIGDVEALEESCFEAAAECLEGEDARHFRHVARREEGVILLLDLDRCLDLEGGAA